MGVKVSIICPVYNAEQYLKKCINSFIAQSFCDWELLLIDDGSPDNSGFICDEYAKKDNRIKVIHKSNEGVSAARQVGFESATGDYMIHADPDDWVESSMLADLYDKAITEQADMVICDFYRDEGDKSFYIKQEPTSLSSDSVLKELFSCLHGSCCNKLIKRETCLNLGVRFPENVNYSEDVCFNVQLLKHNIKVVYLPKAYYHYIQLSTSITNSFSMKTLDNCKKYINYLCDILPRDSEEVMCAKEMVKLNVVNSNLYTDKEILQLYPEVVRSTASKMYARTAYTLAFQGHQKSARLIMKIVKQLVRLREKLLQFKCLIKSI